MKITYKLVSILLGVGAAVAAFTANIFTLLSTPTFGNPTKYNFGIPRIVQLSQNSAEAFGAITKSEGFAAIKAAFIAAAVFFFLAALCGILAAGFAIFSDKPAFNIAFSAGGIVSLICSSIAMSNISSAFASGAVAITDFLDIGMLGGGIVGSLMKIGSVTTGSAYMIMGACFAGLLLWALCFVLTELGEPKPAKKKNK